MSERAVLKWIDYQTLEDGRTVVTAVAEIDGTYHGAGFGIVGSDPRILNIPLLWS